MSKPTIVTVDDDPAVSAAISRDLRTRYGADYRVVRTTSGEQALSVLSDLALKARPVALITTDQRMPGMTGVEFLTHTRQLYPGAKRALLFERGNRTTREPILQGMALGQIDYYVPKPERPPDEEFHSEITRFLEDWAKDYRLVRGGAHSWRAVVSAILRAEGLTQSQRSPARVHFCRLQRGEGSPRPGG